MAGAGSGWRCAGRDWRDAHLETTQEHGLTGEDEGEGVGGVHVGGAEQAELLELGGCEQAHLLTIEQHENLRMLISAEMDSRSPAAVVLIGQPTLRRRHQGALPAIDQRITMRVHLDGMDLAQTANYIRHHLALAGRKDTLFSDDAIMVIHQASRGLTRRQQPRPPIPGRHLFGQEGHRRPVRRQDGRGRGGRRLIMQRRPQFPPDDHFADSDCWPDRTLIPSTDAACRAVLDHALTCLIMVRGGNTHDPGALISTLVSLIADGDARLGDAVADARHHGYTWNHIAERLGSTVPAARHRFAGYVRYCRQLRLFD